MKKIILFLLLITLLSCLGAEAQYYNCIRSGRNISFTLNVKEIVVKFRENYSYIRRNVIVGNRNIEPLAPGTTDQKLTLFSLKPGTQPQEVVALISWLNNIPDIEFASPKLNCSDNAEVGLTNEIIVKLRSLRDTVVLKRYCGENGFIIKVAPNPGERTPAQNLDLAALIAIPKQQVNSIFDIVRKIQATALFSYAEINFLHFKTADIPNDPLLPSQWGWAKINVQGAWNSLVLSAFSSVKIALLDDGVELTHPDLYIPQGFDATFSNSPSNMSAGQQNSWDSQGAPDINYDSHGTLCAGIIAARTNNSTGIAGMGPYTGKLNVISIRLFRSTQTNGPLIGDDFIDAKAITYAWQNGASVISCSWSHSIPTTIVEDAIDDACTLGRNGLGCIMFFSSGNNNSVVKFPASYDKVIAVGATDNNDARCTPAIWGTGWGSCFGTNLDIAAPGNDITTTDITGSKGKNTSAGANGNYYSFFSGTSAACPQAAGVMGLILLTKPNLTLEEARYVLESTCDKVGGYLYTNAGGYQPNGTWCQELGYGRINAKKAVDLAKSMTPAASTQYSSCSAQYAEDIMRDANNNGWRASVNFDINQRSTTKVINVCNGDITLNPKDRWLFTYETSGKLCSQTDNMWQSAYKVYIGALKNRCDCRWLRLFIAVQECDEDLNLIGPEAAQWFYFYDSDQGVMLETKTMRSFNLNQYMPNGTSLQDGKYYKIKVASFDNGKFTQPWCEHSGYVRVYKDNLVIQYKTIRKNQFANTIRIENSTVPAYLPIKVAAKTKISILPNTTLKSGRYYITNFDCNDINKFN